MTSTPLPSLPPGLRLVREWAGIGEYRLDNGLQVVLKLDAARPEPLRLTLTFHAGAKHENHGESGMAHTLEHMVFKNPACDACNDTREFKRRTVQFGAHTGHDLTLYEAVLAPDEDVDDNLAWCLGWFAGTMNQKAFLSQRRLEMEKSVLRNEADTGEDDVLDALQMEIMAAMFKWHRYGNAIQGSARDVAASDADNLKAFYLRFYRPDNASLVISGQGDASAILAQIAERFGSIAAPATPLPTVPAVEPQQPGEREVVLRRAGVDSVLRVAYRGPGIAHQDMPAVALLSWVLENRLAVLNGPVGRISVSLLPLIDASLLICTLDQLRLDWASSRAQVLAQLEAARPIELAELDRAQIQLLASPVFETLHEELVEGVGLGDWRLMMWLKQGCREVTLGGLRAVAGTLLQPCNRTLGILQPSEAVAPAWRAAALPDLDAWAALPQSTVATATLPAGISAAALMTGAQRFVLYKGMRVALFSHADGYPAVVAALRIELSDNGLRDQYLLPYLLQQSLHISEFARADDWNLRSEAGLMRLDVELAVWQADRLAEALTQLCRQLAASARLSLDECRHLRAGIGHTLANGSANNDIGLCLHQDVDETYPFAAGHPHYHPAREGFAAALDQSDLAPLLPALAGALATARIGLGIAGEVDEAAVRQALAAGCADWPAARSFRPLVFDAAAQRTPESKIVATPGRRSARLLVVGHVPDSGHADYPAIRMANHLLEQRLWTRLREQEGLGYIVNTLLNDEPRCAEPFLVWLFYASFAPVDRQRVEQCLDEELARARRDGFDERELQDGKAHFAHQGWFRHWYAQQPRIHDPYILAGLLASGSNRNDQAQHYVELAALSVAQVNGALVRHLDPARMHRRCKGDFPPSS